MANIQRFDELNRPSRSIPYEKYFGDMYLSEAQKRRRIKLAFELEDLFVIFFEMIRNGYRMNQLNEYAIKQELTTNLYTLLADDYFMDETELEDYIIKTVRNKYNSTIRNIEAYTEDYDFDDEEKVEEEGKTEPESNKKNYWLSEDRAILIAENEANTICNNSEYNEAVKAGKEQKRWRIFDVDGRTRRTHLDMAGKTIPISQYFQVGEALLLYPKDVTSKDSTGDEHREEIENCRCSIEYL